MNIFDLNNKTLIEKVHIIKEFDIGFIIALLKMGEIRGLNRDNDEEFYLLDQELEKRSRQLVKTIYS
ncbi:hypothetical protein [uncultured Anaerococcus sp.]|uniref:hypothetical protein n=1 Tax=uncultured Anaerococcus sp. TaxID=293428 RepID=UPI002624A168|nr:hypothetical protein [uncultured Anaerococcus sp.]